MPLLSTIIVGGGPGGLGPLIWAAQQGLLPSWLNRGVVIVEHQAHLGGTLGRFGIHSDSLGGSYLECLEAPHLPATLACLRDDPVTHEMAGYRQGFPPLALVDRFMRRIGSALGAMFTGQSSLYLRTTAQAVRLQPDGSVTVTATCPEGSSFVLSARSAILAMGGRQHCPQVAVPSERHVIPSDQLLTVEGLRDANELMAVAGSKRILILGGSHSAYAAAGALLELPAAQQLARGQVVIVQRREPRIFYPDQDAARHDGYDVAPGDICPRTQRVNRMGGLRGYGRETWRQITDRPGLQPETRVVRMALQDLSAMELRTAIDTAALVVPCFGYRSVTLPVFDSNGERFELNADKGGIAVGDDCRLLTADQRKLPNLFGIGLGTGYRLPASMGGEPNFDGQANSLWLYQNDIGATIYRAIDELSPALAPETPPDVLGELDRAQGTRVAVLASPNPGF